MEVGHINPVSNRPLIYAIPVTKIFVCRETFGHIILIVEGKLFILTVGLLVLVTVISHFKLISLHPDPPRSPGQLTFSRASQDL